MTVSIRNFPIALAALLLVAPMAQGGDCKVSEAKEKIDNAEHIVVVLENDRIRVEIIPDARGGVRQLIVKGGKGEKDHEPLVQWIGDDWSSARDRFGEACTYRIDSHGPERAAVTVSFQRTIEPGTRGIPPTDKQPLRLAVERTISIERDRTSVVVEMKVTNIGDHDAHALEVPGFVAEFGPPPENKEPLDLVWLLRTSFMLELFDSERGARDMAESNFGEGASVNHRFSAFTPGVSADGPRYEVPKDGGGFAAVIAPKGQGGQGRVFLFYDADWGYVQYAFNQHPHTRLSLSPRSNSGWDSLQRGASHTSRVTIALDLADAPRDVSSIAFTDRKIPGLIHAGDTLPLHLRATTLLAEKTGRAAIHFELATKSGATVAADNADVSISPTELSNVDLKFKVPESAAPGEYQWSMEVNGDRIDGGNVVVAPSDETVIAAAASAFKLAPERLEQLKRGGDWWYDQITRGAVSGSLHLVLTYNDTERTFTLNKTRLQPGWTILSSAVFSAERSPALKKFSMDVNGQKVSGELSGGTLSGVDIDGDPFAMPWRADAIPDSAVPFVAMAMDWGRDTQFKFSIADTAVGDLLPPETVVPRRARNTPNGSRVAVICDFVRINDMNYVIDDQGRIVEISDAVRPDVWRLTEAPKYKPEVRKENEPEPIDDAVAHVLVDKVAENPPASGQLVQSVLPKAARVGLLPGDIITLYDGAPVETYQQLRTAVVSARAAQKESVEIQFVRGAETKKASVGVGTIGIQCAGVTKGKPVDLEDAMFAGMGFGPGPKPPPTALEKLAREKCGSQIQWLTDYDKALAEAMRHKKPILWWATPIHGSSTYKLKMFNEYLKMGLFTNPQVSLFIKLCFTPYSGPLTKKQMDAFGLKHLTAPALLFVGGDGKLLCELDGLTSLEPEFYLRYFERVAATNPFATSAEIDLYTAETDRSQTFKDNAKAHELYLNGLSLARQHHAEPASHSFEAALEVVTDAKQATDVRVDMAWVLIHSNHPDKALESIQRNVNREFPREKPPEEPGPRAAEARFAEGVALLMLNRDTEARAVWKDTAEKNPDNPWGWRCAAEAEGLGPLTRGAESPLWVDLSAIDNAKELKDLPHSTTVAPTSDAKAAAQAGVEFLLEHQSADGGWNDTQYDFGGIKAMPNVRTAVTAICAEALLAHRDVAPERVDAALQRAWTYVTDRSHITWADKNEIIWAHIYRMNFFAAFLNSCSPGLKTQVRDEMQKISDTLTRDNIGPRGFFRHEYENEFVTASVLLSLRLAKDAGITVDERAMKRACDALESARTPRGTWPYETTPNPDMAWKGSSGRAMICEAALVAWGRGTQARLNNAIEQYLRYNFVQNRVRKETFHSDRYGVAGFFYWYNQHALSQAARFADADTAHDAAEFMKKLALSTREIDGVWVDSLELGKTYATGLALLVLKAGL